MDDEMKKLLAVLSIALAAAVIVMLLLSGFDLSGFEIHKGIKIN